LPSLTKCSSAHILKPHPGDVSDRRAAAPAPVATLARPWRRKPQCSKREPGSGRPERRLGGAPGRALAAPAAQLKAGAGGGEREHLLVLPRARLGRALERARVGQRGRQLLHLALQAVALTTQPRELGRARARRRLQLALDLPGRRPGRRTG